MSDSEVNISTPIRSDRISNIVRMRTLVQFWKTGSILIMNKGIGVMSRVILAPNDDLTPFDLRAQILRVNVELSVDYCGQKKNSK